jgi:hypothetical protein
MPSPGPNSSCCQLLTPHRTLGSLPYRLVINPGWLTRPCATTPSTSAATTRKQSDNHRGPTDRPPAQEALSAAAWQVTRTSAPQSDQAYYPVAHRGPRYASPVRGGGWPCGIFCSVVAVQMFAHRAGARERTKDTQSVAQRACCTLSPTQFMKAARLRIALWSQIKDPRPAAR